MQFHIDFQFALSPSLSLPASALNLPLSVALSFETVEIQAIFNDISLAIFLGQIDKSWPIALEDGFLQFQCAKISLLFYLDTQKWML